MSLEVAFLGVIHKQAFVVLRSDTADELNLIFIGNHDITWLLSSKLRVDCSVIKVRTRTDDSNSELIVTCCITSYLVAILLK